MDGKIWFIGLTSAIAYPNNRSTVESQVVLPQEVCDQLQRDDGLRVMLYSSVESTLQPYMNKHDVAFPQNIEVRVNGEEVKTNFKGLKNKAGSTKPADITNLIKKTAGYHNTLRVIYALTQKVRFYLFCQLLNNSFFPRFPPLLRLRRSSTWSSTSCASTVCRS